MGLLYNLQNRMLKRAIKKGKDSDYLADKFPMIMLLENGAFVCVDNSYIYKPVNSNKLYNVGGVLLGESISDDLTADYIIVKNESEFENADENTSYAVYDREAKCVVPHGCYATVYQTENYVVLTMPMEDPIGGRVKRIRKEDDEEIYMSATGKTLEGTIYNLEFPKSLIVSKNKIVNTYYASMVPAPIKEYNEQPLPYNIIWIAQTKNRAVSVKLDKRLHIIETYSLPYYSYTQPDLFYMNHATNDVYKLNVENQEPKRISLRTGKTVNLITMETQRLLKKDRVLPETSITQQKPIEVQEEIVEENYEGNLMSI